MPGQLSTGLSQSPLLCHHDGASRTLQPSRTELQNISTDCCSLELSISPKLNSQKDSCSGQNPLYLRLRLQMCATTPSFSHGSSGAELRSSYLNIRHFTVSHLYNPKPTLGDELF